MKILYNGEMNKKKLAIVIALVVIIVVVLGIFAFGNKAKAPEVSNGTAPTSTAPQTATSTASSSGLSIVISTNTPKSYSGVSFSFTYPGAWTISSAMPLLMDDFSGKYKAGGVIPAGGAQLAIATTTSYGPVENIIATELMNATDVASSTTAVDGVACTKATYRANYSQSATAQNISLYCLRGTELWKIYFSYPAGDAAASADLSVFNGILASMKLKE